MTTAASRHSDRRVSPVFVGIVAVMAVTGWATWTGFAEQPGVGVFLFVTAGWVVSLCLHEYGHARTALHSGDITVGAKGYLTLNPLKYTHPVYSFVMPVVFILLGGIAMPGGAVFIDRSRIRGRWRHSAISAAGPAVNALCALVCLVPLGVGLLDGAPIDFQNAVAYLGLLQVIATILNALPVPGLDGYGVVEPWLSYANRRAFAHFAPYGMMAVFILLWQSSVNDWFFGDVVYPVVNALSGGHVANAWMGMMQFRILDLGNSLGFGS